MASIKDVEKAIEAQEEAVTVEIEQPDGSPYLSLEGKPATISVLGSESKRYRDAESQTASRIIRGGRRKLSPEQIRANRIGKAVAVVVGWYGWDDGKKDLPCTPDNVKEVVRHEHILRQVEAAIDDHAGFSGSASGS